MNKTANLIIFFIVAFVFNIVVFLVFIVAILFLVQLIMGPNPNETVYLALMFLAFLVSIVATFLIYSWLMKKAATRFNLEKHIPQLFKRKK